MKIILVPVFLISSIPGEDYSGSSLFDFEHTYLVKIILVPVFLISSIPGEDYSGSSLFDFEHTW